MQLMHLLTLSLSQNVQTWCLEFGWWLLLWRVIFWLRIALPPFFESIDNTRFLFLRAQDNHLRSEVEIILSCGSISCPSLNSYFVNYCIVVYDFFSSITLTGGSITCDSLFSYFDLIVQMVIDWTGIILL